MEWSFVFFLNSALLGVGLAMDAFSVSMANGLHDPRMSRGTMCRIAGTFALFQAVMPSRASAIHGMNFSNEENSSTMVCTHTQPVLGGIILIGIGLEIFISGVF